MAKMSYKDFMKDNGGGTPLSYYDPAVYHSRNRGGTNLFEKYGKSDMLKRIKEKQEKEDEEKNKKKKGQEKIENEVKNYEKRLEHHGVKHDEDKRNGLEKFLNLKEGQNTFFDVLEILDRPADANRELMTSLLQGEGLKSFGDAFKNLKGKNDTSGIDLNRQIGKNLGISGDDARKAMDESPVGLVTRLLQEDPEKRKKVYEAIGGFGTEVVADPMNVIGGGLVKGTGKVLGGTVKVTDKVLSKSDNYVKGKEGFKDLTGHVRRQFDPNMDLPPKVKEMLQSLEAVKNGKVEIGMKKLNKMFKDNPNIGNHIGRLLEDGLVNNPQAKEMLQQLSNLSPNSEILLRGGDGTNVLGTDLSTMKNLVNTQVIKSPKYQKKIQDTIDRQKKHEDIIRTVAQKHGTLDDLDLKIENLDLSYGKPDLYFRESLNNSKTKKELNAKVDEILKGVPKNKQKAIKDVIKDAWQLKISKQMASNAKYKADDLFSPIKIDKIAKNVKPTDLPKEARTELASLLKERKALKSANDIDYNALGQVETKIKNLMTKNGYQKGVSVTKSKGNKTAIANALFRGQGEVLENYSKITNKDTVDIPRITRELTDNPEAQRVADVMKGMQDELLQWGTAIGVNIDEINGYMRHAITEQYRNAMMKNNNSGSGANGKAVVKKRQMYGSAEDVNEMTGDKVFETDAYKAFVDGYQKVANYIATEGFVTGVLNNPQFAQPFNDEVMKKLPFDKKGKRVLPKGKTILKLNDFDFYNSIDANGLNHLSVRPSKEYLVDKGTHDLLKRYDALVTDPNIVLQGFDGMMKVWKGFQLMSIGYHARNVMGNALNRYLGGMNFVEQMQYDTRAAKSLHEYNTKIVKHMTDGTEHLMTPKQQRIKKEVEEFYHTGLRDGSKVQDEMGTFETDFEKLQRKIDPDSVPKPEGAERVTNALKKGFEATAGANFKVGNMADDVQRFGMYMWGKQAKSVPNPIAKVKEAMFDYNDITSFERNVMKRIMPFYTFTRKNLPFQIRSLTMQNPVKFSHIMRGVEASYNASGQDQETMPDYLKESFGMANPFSDNEMLKTYLPMSDLVNWSTPKDALETATSMINPLAKLPIENKTNFDTFREREIQQYEGEKSDRYGGLVSPMMAHNLDNLGARNPEKLISSLAKLGTGNLNPEKSNTSELLSSLFTQYNPDQEQYFDSKRERDRLADLVKKYKDETGESVKSIREIEKKEKKKSYKDYIGF